MLIDIFFKMNTKKNNFRYKVSVEYKNTLFAKTDTKIWRKANYFIVTLIVISLLVMILSSFPSVSSRYLEEIWMTNFIINSVFFIEYLYRFRSSSHKHRFVFKMVNIFDLLAFLPFFVLSFTLGVWNYSLFAIFRVFRIFKVFELLERNPVILKIVHGVKQHKFDYLTVLILTGILLLFSSVLVYYFEYHWWDAELFSSLPRSIWWSIVTMTTTWYWDMVPATIIWKSIAVVLMVSWPILTSVIGAITVLVFLNLTENIYISHKKCKNCNEKNWKKNLYCISCWKRFGTK